MIQDNRERERDITIKKLFRKSTKEKVEKLNYSTLLIALLFAPKHNRKRLERKQLALEYIYQCFVVYKKSSYRE